MKNSKKKGGRSLDSSQSFEQRYPTKAAREKADAAFDVLPLTTSLGECIRVWEFTYLDAGGLVRG